MTSQLKSFTSMEGCNRFWCNCSGLFFKHQVFGVTTNSILHSWRDVNNFDSIVYTPPLSRIIFSQKYLHWRSKTLRRKGVFIYHHPPLIFTPTQQKVLKEVRSKGCIHNSISDMFKIHFQLLRLSHTHNSTPRLNTYC